MATLTEQRARAAELAALNQLKQTPLQNMTQAQLEAAYHTAWGGTNTGGDSAYLQSIRNEMANRGTLATFEQSQVSPTTLADLRKGALMTWGLGLGAAGLGGAAAGATGASGATTALPAGGMTATGSVPAGAGMLGGTTSAGAGLTDAAISSGLGATVPAAGLTDAAIASGVGSGTTAAGTTGLLGGAADWMNTNLGTDMTGSQLGQFGLNLGGSLLNQQAAKDAANANAAAQVEAARIAAEAAKFKPVGVKTGFGQSQFGYDAQGNLVSAGYTLDPRIAAQQQALFGVSDAALQQYQGAQAATAPMGTAAQSMFNLGQGYLATTPQEQAAKYMADQQALLAGSREQQLSALQNKLAQQGRIGLATGGTSTGLLATNPEMAAYYNALAQQDLGLAVQATQGGMDYAKFGAGMVGLGGEALKGMYGTQAAAYTPYETAIGGAQTLEGLGQNAMGLGIDIGAKGTAGTAQAGLLTAQGIQNAANVMQPVNAYSPWGTLLSGMGSNWS